MDFAAAPQNPLLMQALEKTINEDNINIFAFSIAPRVEPAIFPCW